MQKISSQARIKKPSLPKKPTQKKPPAPLAGAVHHPLEEQAAGPFYRAVLPLAPGVNQAYAIGQIRTKNKATGIVTSHSRFIGTEKLHNFKTEAQKTLSKVQLSSLEQEVVSWLVDHKKDKKKVPLQLSITTYYPTLWKSDEDKNIKIIQDVIFQAIELDDKVVTDLTVKKRVSDNPRIEIELSLLKWEEEGDA